MPLDPFDPYGGLGAMLGLNNVAVANQQPRPPQPPPLTDEETSSILDKIGAAGLGGLSFVGGMLNKPGRAVRGLLGGAPREALNLIPFSDALGITKPEEEVRGTDLLRKAGLHNEDDPSFFSPTGLAGFGVDVLTDPLTYLSFGGHAVSKLGAAAKKVGMLPKTIAERAAGLTGEAADALAAKLGMESSQVAGKALGGHVGVGLPFGGNAATFDLAPLGRGLRNGLEALPGGQAVSGALGTVGKAAKDFYTSTIPPLFQGAVAGRTTAAGQDIARNITERTPETLAKARMEIMPLAQQSVDAGLGSLEGGAAIRQAAETGLGTDAARGIAGQGTDLLARDLGEKFNQGLPAHALAPQEIRAGEGAGQQLGMFPRQTAETPDQAFKNTKSLAPSTPQARIGAHTGLTTKSINEIAFSDLSAASRTDLDPLSRAELAKKNPVQQVQQTIMDKYLNGAGADKAVEDAEIALHSHKVASGGVVTDDEVVKNLTHAETQRAALRKQAQELAEMKVNGRSAEFHNHAMVDLANYHVKHNMDMMKSEELYRGLAKAAGPKGQDTMSVMDAINRFWNPSNTAGESITDAAGNFVGHTPPQGATIQMENALRKAGFQGSVLDAHIPAHVAEDIAGLGRMSSIKGTSEFGKLWDSVTNLTKAYQTFTPSTVIRNAAQDVYNKLVYGMHDPSFAAADPRRYTQPISDWMKIANGGTVEGLAAKLQHLGEVAGKTDAEAADHVRKLYTAWDVGREGFKRTAIKEGADVVGGGAVGKGIEQILPISQQRSPLSAYGKGLKEGSYTDLLGAAGVGGRTEDTFAPVKAMRSANNANDNIMRGSSFLAKLEQGNEPAQAFADVMKAHYDFGNMSEFERTYMRRLVPFYSWARQNIPAVISEIADNPGGKLATTIKGVERAKGEHAGLIPNYIREGVAAPIGAQDENGQQRYLSHLGLGFEDLGQLFGPGGPLGMLNPLIKAPIEQATGRQLFSGRDLRDLHSRIGDLTGQPLPTLENVAMNSPVGRTLSMLGTAADPRKSILDKTVNLATGARLQDVDVNASRMAALRDYLQENLRGPAFRHFDELSVRPEDLQMLSPQEMNLYRLYRGLGQKGKPVQQALNTL